MALQRSPLHKLCLQEKCRMVPFANWEMPIHFSGLINEHKAVRTQAGIFDISHMGVIQIESINAKDLLQDLVPSDLHRIGPGEACYTVLLNEKAGIIDDIIIYDMGINDGLETILIIVNAACKSKDIEWIREKINPSKYHLCDKKKDGILLALQGPSSKEILERYLNESLSNIPKFGHRIINLNSKTDKEGSSVFISRTGYTGEDGFEILLSSQEGNKLWSQLIHEGVTPCGLGARDTLRLEAGMHLYGNDLDSTTSPFEAGLGWLVHLEMPCDFYGREILEKQAKEGVHRRLIGLELQDRAIPRKGYQVFHKSQVIGHVTSGSWSPSLEKGIALAYVKSQFARVGERLWIDIRGKKTPAKIVKKPFYKNSNNN